jgi:hypothetical protein
MILDGKGSCYFYHLPSNFNLRALEPRISSGSRTANVSSHQPYGALITGIVKWVSPSNRFDALKKIALELHISTDFLLFDAHERGPSDDLALKLEAVHQMPEDEQMVIREVLESLIIKYQSRRWDSGRQATKG